MPACSALHIPPITRHPIRRPLYPTQQEDAPSERPLYQVFLSLYQSGIIPPCIDRITFLFSFSLRTAPTNLEMFSFRVTAGHLFLLPIPTYHPILVAIPCPGIQF